MEYTVMKRDRNKKHPYYVIDADGVDVAHCINKETANEIAKALEGFEIEKENHNMEDRYIRPKLEGAA